VLQQGQVVEHGPIDELLANARSPSVRNRPEFGAVLAGQIVEFDPARSLAVVRVGETLLTVTGTTGVVGAAVRVHVPAREVILATERPARVSVRNVLECRVAALSPADAGAAHVRLTLGTAQIVASVTPDAVRELELVPGARVFALIKSASLDLPAGARSLRIS
jgi:molybdate transport system ATP-binding protein